MDSEEASTLKTAWEQFAAKELPAEPMLPDDEVALLRHCARRSFYAGAQSFVAIVSAALAGDDEAENVEAWQRLEEAYDELASTLEEMKL